jgi:hypothetical protein
MDLALQPDPGNAKNAGKDWENGDQRSPITPFLSKQALALTALKP